MPASGVVELGLGDAIADVEGWEKELALVCQLLQSEARMMPSGECLDP